MYLSGAMPAELGTLQSSCSLPDGTTAACVPIALAPEAMYATSVSMSATLADVFTTTTPTGTSVMRLREPSGGGPITGYITAGSDGMPQMEIALSLYLDAPDMSLPLGAKQDLHSKPLSVVLEGPVTVLADGRMSIAASNIAAVPLTVNISANVLVTTITGAVDLSLPAGEMKLQLVSPPLRGAPQ
jgi:hypothetical protein